MGQITEDFAHQMLRHTGHGQHPPLTVWEAEQLARAWLEREILRHERDHARAQLDSAVKLLTGIHNLLYPAQVTTQDGREEAIQTAAMALRLAMSLSLYDYAPAPQHSQSRPAAADGYTSEGSQYVGMRADQLPAG